MLSDLEFLCIRCTGKKETHKGFIYREVCVIATDWENVGSMGTLSRGSCRSFFILLRLYKEKAFQWNIAA